jgi:hypothetical protein
VKRRGFLGLLGAAIAAPWVPTPAPTCRGVDLASKPDVGTITVVMRCDDREFQAALRRARAELVYVAREIRPALGHL